MSEARSVGVDTDLPNLKPMPREQRSAEITRSLLDFLLSGTIEPGQRIPPERRLTEALGVGRSAVREAIKSLSLLGLLEVRQGDGTYLTGTSSDLLPRVIEWGMLLDEPYVADLVEARERIEPIIAGLAAERRDEGALEDLKSLIATMTEASDDIDRYVDADTAFHLRLAEAAGNRALSNFLGSLQSLLRAWAKRVLEAAGETETSLAMHEPILKAVEKGDAAAATRAMEAHMERASRRLRAALAVKAD
jgi:GntR family transcriptional repressor for pyruvate dehydrogenase complex